MRAVVSRGRGCMKPLELIKTLKGGQGGQDVLVVYIILAKQLGPSSIRFFPLMHAGVLYPC